MKSRLLSLALTFVASAAAAQAPAAEVTPTPAQQAQPVAPSPADAAPAASGPVAPAAPPAVAPAAPPAQATPRVYVSRPVLVQPAQRPYPPPPYRLPPPREHPLQAEPRRPRVYGNAGAPFSLGVGGSLLWRDEDYRRFGSDKLRGGFDAFASYDVWSPARVFVLAAGLAFRHDERPRTELATMVDNLLSAELTARFRATSWLWPHVRAGVGLATTRVSLRDSAAQLKFEDHDAGAAGTFGAGFTLRTPTRALETERGRLASLSLGLMFEGGYTLAAEAKLSPEPTHSGDIRRASPASFSAERSAAFFRVLGVVRF